MLHWTQEGIHSLHKNIFVVIQWANHSSKIHSLFSPRALEFFLAIFWLFLDAKPHQLGGKTSWAGYFHHEYAALAAPGWMYVGKMNCMEWRVPLMAARCDGKELCHLGSGMTAQKAFLPLLYISLSWDFPQRAADLCCWTDVTAYRHSRAVIGEFVPELSAHRLSWSLPSSYAVVLVAPTYNHTHTDSHPLLFLVMITQSRREPQADKSTWKHTEGHGGNGKNI